MTENNLFQEPNASMFEGLRSLARKKRKITYDCFNAKVFGERVKCSLGHITRGTQHVTTLLSVLKGRSTIACQKCPDYDDGGKTEE